MKVTLSADVYRKMRFLTCQSGTEVGGWGIADDPLDPLSIKRFVLTKQVASVASIDFDDEGTCAFRAKCREEGLIASQYTKAKMHTHPGNSAAPSSTDWDDFYKVQMESLIVEYKMLVKMGDSSLQPPWQVMVIVAKDGAMSAHIATFIPEINCIISDKIDIEAAKPQESTIEKEWLEEYKVEVSAPPTFVPGPHKGGHQYWPHRLYDPGHDNHMIQTTPPHPTGGELFKGSDLRGNPRKAQKKTISEIIPVTAADNLVTMGDDLDSIMTASKRRWRKLRNNNAICQKVVWEFGNLFGIDEAERLKMTPEQLQEAADSIYYDIRKTPMN